jgi:hypothetical protein
VPEVSDVTDASVPALHSAALSMPAEVKWFDRNISSCKTWSMLRADADSYYSQEPNRIAE